MDKLIKEIRRMIRISDEELGFFLENCVTKTFRRLEQLSMPDEVPNEIFFINRGLVRVTITDIEGEEHTTHFALEDQFIADYSCFMLRQPSIYALQALEETEVVVMPRSAIEWGYANLAQGDRLGRCIAEFYFIYHDARIRNIYSRTSKERYDSIHEVFPGIHDRVPQHMIASYLGITPVHLSRLKKAAMSKSKHLLSSQAKSVG